MTAVTQTTSESNVEVSSAELISPSNESILAQMDPKIREIAERGRSIMATGMKTNALTQHKLGQLLLKIDGLVADGARESTIMQVATCWGFAQVNLTTLYNLRNVAKRFSYATITAELDKPLRSGASLNWSHFCELQKIEDDARVAALLTQIRDNSWSAKELAMQLSGTREVAITRTGGRKPAIPSTTLGIVRKVAKKVQETENYLKEIVEPLDKVLEDGVDYDDALIDGLSAAIERLSTIKDNSAEILQRLKRIKSSAGKVAANKPTAAEKGGVPKKPGKGARKSAKTVEAATV